MRKAKKVAKRTRVSLKKVERKLLSQRRMRPQLQTTRSQMNPKLRMKSLLPMVKIKTLRRKRSRLILLVPPLKISKTARKMHPA
jgi:hypothetical protein